MEWNRAKSLALIEEYEKHPELWNPKHEQYYFKSQKQAAWTSIESVLECPKGEAKKKMESLLSSFRREKAKAKNNGNVYNSHWFAFAHMAFLLDRYESRTTSIENETSADLEEGEETDSLNEIQESMKIEVESETDSECPLAASTSASVALSEEKERISVNSRYKHKKLCKESTDTITSNKVIEALDILTTAATNNTLKADDCGVYGQHVANKLRTYSRQTRNIVQHRINTILFNADMGQYDGNNIHIFSNNASDKDETFTNNW